MEDADRTDAGLLEVHARTLFTHDARGRLLAVNSASHAPAVRFFAAWAPRVRIWRVRDDLPADVVARLGEIMAGEPPGGDVHRAPAWLDAVRAVLAEHAPVKDHFEGGPAYRFPERIEAAIGAVTVTAHNAEVLRRWLPEWLPDVSDDPMMAVLVDGAAVALCACARQPGEATEAGVETHEAFRGRGYAGLATAAWARAIRERGIIPLYSTSWQNLASQRVATKLGLVCYGASLSLD